MRDITRNIEAANTWLLVNRPNAKPISLADVQKRAKTGKYLSVEADTKTIKGSINGYLTGILYLAPHNITGFNVCVFAKTCINDCLFNAGRGRFVNVTRARIVKTLAFLMDSESFVREIEKDINRLRKKANKQNMMPVVRLNGTSDLTIESIYKDVLSKHSDVQFYDYTKAAFRFKRELPANYHLTFSHDGVNTSDALSLLARGFNVAVVFENSLPEQWFGITVINGDETDLRFLDAKGVVVGLKAKGSAKKNETGFVVTKKQYAA